MEKEKENNFFLEKLEFDYGSKKALSRLKKITEGIEWLKGWPEDKTAFWNGEAFMWRSKISSRKRELIKKELCFLEGKKKRNLDLGCGSYSYVAGSVGFDIAEKMLLLNRQLSERVTGDLEEGLSFDDQSFDSATIVFLLDYIQNYTGVLREVYRVLKQKGKLMAVQPKGKVNRWQGQKIVEKLSFKELKEALEMTGFRVKFYEKEGLEFFRCEKR